MSETKCTSCGCACIEDQEMDTTVGTTADHHGETEFAVLLALVPAMTMTLFNLMGLL